MSVALLVPSMSERVDSESTISGNQANIPARIRRELDIDDGDRIRWKVEDDDTLRVQIVQRRNGTLSGFDGYGGDEDTDVTVDHGARDVDTPTRRPLPSRSD